MDLSSHSSRVRLRSPIPGSTVSKDRESHVTCTMILIGHIVSEASSHAKRLLKMMSASPLMLASAVMATSRSVEKCLFIHKTMQVSKISQISI